MKVYKPLAVVAVAVSCLGAYWLGSGFGSRESKETKSPPVQVIDGLAVDPMTLDLGEVWEAKAVPVDVSLQNKTNQEIIINNFAVSCACMEVELRSLRIGSGQIGRVRLTLDLTHRGPWEQHLSPRPLLVKMAPVIQGKGRSADSWDIRGTIRSRVTLDTKFLEFGQQVVHDGLPVTRKVTVVAHVPVVGLAVSAEPPLAEIAVVPLLDQENQFQILVTPHTTLEPGPFKFDLFVQVKTSAGEVFVGYILPVAGTVEPEIRALPARLLLGAKPVGQSAEATVILQVPQGSKWAVDHIEISSPDIRVEPIETQAGSTNPMYRVSFRLTKEGDQSGTVSFFVRKGGQRPMLIAMAVSAYGEALKPEEGKVKP